MLDFGNVDAHGNSKTYGDINALDAPAAYTISMWITLNALVAPTNKGVFSKTTFAAGAGNGWRLMVTGAEQLRMQHFDAGGTTTADATTALVVGTPTHYAMSWSAAAGVITYYRNGGLDGNPALARNIVANATNVQLGDTAVAGNDGAPVRLGHVMWWNVAFTFTEMRTIYFGIIPQPANLKFWVPGWTSSGIEVLQNNVGAIGTNGVVNYAEDPFHHYGTLPVPTGHMVMPLVPPAPQFVLIN